MEDEGIDLRKVGSPHYVAMEGLNIVHGFNCRGIDSKHHERSYFALTSADIEWGVLLMLDKDDVIETKKVAVTFE